MRMEVASEEKSLPPHDEEDEPDRRGAEGPREAGLG